MEGAFQYVSRDDVLNRKIFVVLIIAAFCLANITRAAYRARLEQPRFSAEGAAHFRYTEMIAQGRPIPSLDARAQWPEGLRVFRETSPFMEYLFGWTWRLIPDAKPDLATFVRYGTAFFFSLAIFPLSLLSARLWRSRAAGALTALLFAAALPLVARSSGFEFIRENVTFPLLVYHMFFYVSACAGGGPALAVLSGVFLFAALASWHGAQFYLVPLLLFALVRSISTALDACERRVNRAIVCAIAAAGVIVPYLREGRFLLSISASFAAAVLAIDFVSHRAQRRSGGRAGMELQRRIVRPETTRAIVAILVIAAIVGPGLISGGHFASYSHFFSLVLNKFRYFAKPDDPRLLPFDARAFWVGPFNSPDPLHLFVFALPLLLLLPGPLWVLVRRSKERDFAARFTLVFLAVYFVCFLLMQRLLPLFGFFAVVAAGGGFQGSFRYGGHRGIVRPSLLVLAAVVAIFLFQDFGWEGRRDYWRAVARSLKVPSREKFVIFPYGRDVEGDLLEWIRRNVEPNDVVMSLHYLSPQILTYTGRATNLNDFFESPGLRRKAERFLTLLYSDESGLYRFCEEQSSDYLLVSCAVGCDATKESPLYQAGLINMPPGSAAYHLMFEPERLTRFGLVYENEMYRLFRVGGKPGAQTGPRSPLFYERELLWNMNGDIEKFYNAVMHIYALTARGRTFQARGADRKGEDDLVAALRTFYFYPAWKALDGLYARRGRTGDRETVAALAYRYDPNRSDVCLALAASRIELGKTDGVLEILDRCSNLPASALDKETADALRTRLESIARQPRAR
jgi:hypothetical protein